MRAMILAAGYGKRLKPITDYLPKVLVPVGGKPLIVHQIRKLARIPVERIVINLGHLGEKIEAALNQNPSLPSEVELRFTRENPPLETGGGIKNALSLLGEKPFIVVSGDIYTDFPYERLPKQLPSEVLAHLVLNSLPPWHPQGDFGLDLDSGQVNYLAQPRLNFAGIGVYHPKCFLDEPKGAFPLNTLFQKAIPKGQIQGEFYPGTWYNVGTLEELAALQAFFKPYSE